MPSSAIDTDLNVRPPPADFSAEEIDLLLKNLDSYSAEEQEEVYKIVDELTTRQRAEAAHRDLIEFCKLMQPDYIVGKHHRILADLLMEIEQGKEYDQSGEEISETGKDRVCVNIPPRHGKSQLVSIYFPAWFLGRNPDKKVMMVSHTTDLAVDFGRKVRNLIGTNNYKSVFPNVALAIDSKSAGRWNTNMGGEYYACGIGSSIAGRGAHLLLVDDPHSEQDVLSGNFDVFDKAYEWFTFGARTRLMPGGRVAIVQTRWHMDDLTGRVVRDMSQNDQADQYNIVEFPALLEVATEDKTEENPTGIVEKPLWPEFFNLRALQQTKASMPLFQWNAQYQQNPTAEEAAIVKREWWQEWKEEGIPDLHHIIQSYDTAFSKKETADYSAITTWGVFYPFANNVPHLILIDAKRGRWDFPELKKIALKEYKYWEPETIIIEAKASGTPLTQELRQLGIPVVNYTPSKGQDKHVRVNSVAPLFESGMIWAPETRWSDDVIEECAAFPYGDHDDLVDSMTQAVMRFRQGNFIRLGTDYVDEPTPKKQMEYY